MNFLYLYPCYTEARRAFVNKRHEMYEKGIADINNLVITDGSDTHKFNYVPIRVHVDLERLGMMTSILHLQPLIEDLLEQTKRELVKLNDFVISSREAFHEPARGTGSNPSPPIQTPNDPPSGRTGDGSALELGSKTISGPALLQGRLDL